MTIILVTVVIFVVGLGMILLFRSAVSRDDELERKWIEAVHNPRVERARRREEQKDAAGQEAADTSKRDDGASAVESDDPIAL